MEKYSYYHCFTFQKTWLVVVEPEFNQAVWLQSQALNLCQNKQLQERAQRVTCTLIQVLSFGFHGNRVLHIWSAPNLSFQCLAW